MSKVVVYVLTFLFSACSAHAAITLQFSRAEIRQPSITWNFSNLDQAVLINETTHLEGVTLKDNRVFGAKGSFSVTLTAAALTDQIDPNAWIFGPATSDIVASRNGLGVGYEEEESLARRITEGEALLLRFDVSALELQPSSTLVFSIYASGNKMYNIYKRIGPSQGIVVESFSKSHVGYTPKILVDGLLEFALADVNPGSIMGLFVHEISFDVVGGGQREEAWPAETQETIVRQASQSIQPSSFPQKRLSKEPVTTQKVIVSKLSLNIQEETSLELSDYVILLVSCVFITIVGVFFLLKKIS